MWYLLDVEMRMETEENGQTTKWQSPRLEQKQNL